MLTRAKNSATSATTTWIQPMKLTIVEHAEQPGDEQRIDQRR